MSVRHWLSVLIRASLVSLTLHAVGCSQEDPAANYTGETNTWIYTQGFAERFGMPRQWIDEDLKGAYAVAFRVEVQPARLRGLGGNPDAAMIDRQCILDVFLDVDAPVPWVNDRVAGFRHTPPAATLYLRPRSETDWQPRRDPVGLSIVGDTAVIRSEREGIVSGLIVTNYDKVLYRGITFISFSRPCTTPPVSESRIEFRKAGGWSKDPNGVLYSIKIPEQFMDRQYANWYANSRKPGLGEWRKALTQARQDSEVKKLSGNPKDYVNE